MAWNGDGADLFRWGVRAARYCGRLAMQIAQPAPLLREPASPTVRVSIYSISDLDHGSLKFLFLCFRRPSEMTSFTRSPRALRKAIRIRFCQTSAKETTASGLKVYKDRPEKKVQGARTPTLFCHFKGTKFKLCNLF